MGPTRPHPLALVTGASAGLGARFAERLAADGYDLVLVARRAARLERLSAALCAGGSAVHVLPLDLARSGAVGELTAWLEARSLAIDVLINNAGFGLRGPFERQAPGELVDMIELNVRAPVELARALVPGMIARGHGAILNVASTAAFTAGPGLAVYYASKAFLLSFSQALHEECRLHGVRVSCLCPGATATEFGARSGLADSALFRRMQGPVEPVVSAGLAGLRANRAVVVPGWQNRLAVFATRVLPRSVARRGLYRLQRD